MFCHRRKWFLKFSNQQFCFVFTIHETKVQSVFVNDSNFHWFPNAVFCFPWGSFIIEINFHVFLPTILLALGLPICNFNSTSVLWMILKDFPSTLLFSKEFMVSIFFKSNVLSCIDHQWKQFSISFFNNFNFHTFPTHKNVFH